MLTFVIPVKSRSVSSDWSSFCLLFERTLKSICNQTDPDYKIVVVCHEIPEINFTHKNIHFVQVEFKPPIRRENESNDSINIRREIDKGKKLVIGTNFALKNFNTDYVMTVDSDDYISNRIAAYVNQSANTKPGWYVKNGYIHIHGKNYLISTRKFSNLCGSSVIFKPSLIKYFVGVDSILYFDHRLTKLDNHIELGALPFSGGIYSMANGENHLMSLTKVKESNKHFKKMTLEEIKRVYTKIKNYSFRFVTPRIKSEFSFNLA